MIFAYYSHPFRFLHRFARYANALYRYKQTHIAFGMRFVFAVEDVAGPLMKFIHFIPSHSSSPSFFFKSITSRGRGRCLQYEFVVVEVLLECDYCELFRYFPIEFVEGGLLVRLKGVYIAYYHAFYELPLLQLKRQILYIVFEDQWSQRKVPNHSLLIFLQYFPLPLRQEIFS